MVKKLKLLVFFGKESFGQKILLIALFISFLLLIDCGDSDEKKTKAPLKDFSDPAIQLKEARSVLGVNTQITFIGNFDESEKKELVAGLEINTKDEWGIKFASIDISGDESEKIFETELLEGSLEESRIEKLNVLSKDYELLYYNSADFFMGSGGGEVFSYIVDFNEEEIYYAHLVADNKKISLYLSGNIDDDKIRQFFLNTFKRDFPDYILVMQDIDYDN